VIKFKRHGENDKPRQARRGVGKKKARGGCGRVRSGTGTAGTTVVVRVRTSVAPSCGAATTRATDPSLAAPRAVRRGRGE
jgi:hypothetical protein